MHWIVASKQATPLPEYLAIEIPANLPGYESTKKEIRIV